MAELQHSEAMADGQHGDAMAELQHSEAMTDGQHGDAMAERMLGQMGGSGMVEGRCGEAMVEGRDSVALLIDHHVDIDRAEAMATSPRK
jgi:hypothetical protein